VKKKPRLPETPFSPVRDPLYFSLHNQAPPDGCGPGLFLEYSHQEKEWTMKKILLFSLFVLALTLTCPAFADTVVTETHTTSTGWGWHTVDSPIGQLFHFLGDVVAFPFHLIGNLF
jgi:hypothetical protein